MRVSLSELRLLFLLPLLLFLVVFALSNREQVDVGLWPTDYSFSAPFSLIMLVSMAGAFLAGAVLVWIDGWAHRYRAHRAEQRAQVLETELESLRARLDLVASASPQTLPLPIEQAVSMNGKDLTP